MKKILIVEDDESLAEVAGLFLADEGFESRVLPDGSELTSTLESFAPDIILMDVDLPGEDGDVLTKKLKDNNTFRTPVILTSSFYSLPKLARNVKADGYISKPYDFDDLIEKMEDLMA